MNYITISDKARFKACYTKALNKGKKTFMFRGKEVLISYAKYVIDYLEGITNAKTKRN